MTMTVLEDIRGNPLTGADDSAATAYMEGLTRFNLFIDDPIASAEAATTSAPGFVMGHVLRAWLLLLSTEAPAQLPARESWLAALDFPMTTQEAGHIAAISHLLDGRWHQPHAFWSMSPLRTRATCSRCKWDTSSISSPAARMLRDRIARALSAWSPELPGRHALLGMLAFGLEEMGDYAAAEVAGREAVALERRDAWAQHAVAHVLEMQGRTTEGIAWMCADIPAWTEDNFFAVHNWWHLALYHLEIGEIEEVLRLFDGPIHGARSRVMIDMIDAASLLWRLHLRGSMSANAGRPWRTDLHQLPEPAITLSTICMQ